MSLLCRITGIRPRIIPGFGGKKQHEMKTGISVLIKGMEDLPAYVTPYVEEIAPKKEYYVRYQTAPGHGYIGKKMKGNQIKIKP